MAFALVPDWRRRWLLSPYPWLAALIAVVVFLPVLIWNAQHDWASFRFQLVRAVAVHELSFRTVGDFFGLQFGLVGFVLLPVVLSGVTLTAWRGYRGREPVAILLSTAVLVPFSLFFLEVADAAGRRYLADVPLAGRLCRDRDQPLHAVQRGLAGLDGKVLVRLGEGGRDFRHRLRRRRVFLFMSRRPGISSAGPTRSGGEAGYEQVAARARDQLQKAGATWIATHGLSHLRDAALVLQTAAACPLSRSTSAAGSQDFRDPGMADIKDHNRPLCRARAGQRVAAVEFDDGKAAAARKSRTKLAWHRDG